MPQSRRRNCTRLLPSPFCCNAAATASIACSKFSPENAPDEGQYIEIGFEKGIPVTVDGKKLPATRYVIHPYERDPNLERFAQFKDKAYEFVVAEGLPGADLPLIKSRAVVAWSSLHGFASLRHAGVLTNIPGLPGITVLERELIRQVVTAALLPP